MSNLTVEYAPPEPTVIHPEGAVVRLAAETTVAKKAILGRKCIITTSTDLKRINRKPWMMKDLLHWRQLSYTPWSALYAIPSTVVKPFALLPARQ
jgi:hypothetical protein